MKVFLYLKKQNIVWKIIKEDLNNNYRSSIWKYFKEDDIIRYEDIYNRK